MSEAAEILLVDDNPGDVRLTKETFKEGRILNELHVVNLGREALDYLNQRGAYREAPKPDLVLLDLRLPDMAGTDVLEAIKTESDLQHIPVITLSGSSRHDQVVETYEEYATAHLNKPLADDEFFAVLRTLEEFRIQVVRCPP